MNNAITCSIPRYSLEFITEIASLNSEPLEIWLMGSRANGRERPDSDTDLLIFGPDGFLEEVRVRLQQPTDIDCLVVYDGDNYNDPWQEKRGSLSQLRWNRIDSRAATYMGTMWVPDEESSAEFAADMGQIVNREERAWRVWP